MAQKDNQQVETLRAELEARDRELRGLREELAAAVRLAEASEVVGPVLHEFSNFLNVVGLHLAVLEPEVAPEQRADLQEVRRQGAAMAGLLAQFQRYRKDRYGPSQWVDLNRVILDTVQGLRGGDALAGCEVRTELAAALAPVPGSASDVQRLCTFLVRNAAAATAGGGTVVVRTEQTADRALLRVVVTGAQVMPEVLNLKKEPGAAGSNPANSLEMAACWSLVKRLRGKVRTETPPPGGAVLSVELPTQKPSSAGRGSDPV